MNNEQKELLARYIAELRAVKAPVNAWWGRLIEAELAKTPDKVAAAAALRRRWPDGPATHPRVVAIVRKYYLACERLNEEIEGRWGAEVSGAPHEIGASEAAPEDDDTEGPIPPWIFVGEYLNDEETKDVAKIVATYKYWPIGLSAKGEAN